MESVVKNKPNLLLALKKETEDLVFMKKDDDTHDYIFVHDMMQKAAMKLIHKKHMNAFCHSIGCQLWMNLSESQLQQHVIIVVDMLRKEYLNTKDHVALAGLYLQAAVKATKKSAFSIASTYAKGGLELVGSDGWIKDYDLCLALHNVSAEVHFCTSEFEKLDEAVKGVLDNSRTFHDELQARGTMVYAAGVRDRVDEAVKVGCDVLKQLGEPLPSKPSLIRSQFEILRVTRLLKGRSDSSLMNLPRMTDPGKLACMNMLSLIFLLGFGCLSLFWYHLCV
eukprot:CAMPEP_0118697054 /NCGR_PEP_ID=MMETSP0800-20121206/14244_1 /TAXON_ID=210618 ORGANISM="Striatella unipunctata, Strain CCMP2910" /NCGR_SAMPLE_ID=MMETSP0800 /ASSEMBLY_ACC=CAM_ASM_000638 /LENGTH=279 /DNA_ID=CAMNT_0006596345 /DNA_START=435 /DNA_END=1274 /DNA_ORIENTATION=-